MVALVAPTHPRPPAMPPRVSARWFVLHTRTRQEKALARSLEAMGSDFFLPLVTHARHYGRRRVLIETPLFPSYLFLHGDLSMAYEADRTGRVARIIDVADQDRFEREIQNVRLALSSAAKLDPYPYLRQGVRVIVRSGPLQGIEGMVQSRIRMDRLVLQVQVLGQACSVEIDAALLEVIEAGAAG